MPPSRRFRFSSSSYLGYFPRGVRWLLIVNTVVFLVCYFGGYGLQRHVSLLFALSPIMAVRNFMVWQVFTYMFVHYGIWHLLFNMLAVWMFGMQIELTWGTRRFLKFYFLCGMVAGLCVLVVNMLVGDWTLPTLGASGAVFGLIIAFAILFPDAIILLIIFPIKARYFAIIAVVVEILVTFGPNTGVSTVAHLGGAAFAWVYMKQKRSVPAVRWRLPDIGGAYRQWKLQRAKKKFQVYMRKHGQGPWVN